MKFLVRTTLASLCATFLLSNLIWAQSTSQITGTVHDPSGGAVPGANVKVTQTDTGFTRSMATNGEGDFVLPNLPVGSYRFEVTKDGFSKYVESNLVLEVNVNPTISPTLKIGSVSETVTVEAQALQVETHDTGVGQVIDHEEVADLPLNARDPTQLILLAGNATIQGVSASDLNSNKNFPTLTISVSGAPNANSIAFSLDGATANEPFNGLNQPLPFPDALQEFKVETSSVGAQTGQHAAASVSVVTRSGTNAWHGNVFDYVRNYEFNARNATSLTRDSLKQNQFGGTIGGPIMKNKLFFFVGEQSTIKRSNPASNTGYSMTPAMLTGDFTAIASTASGCQSTNQTIQNAAGYWVGNKLAPSLMSPIALQLAKYLPPSSAQINACGLFYYASGANDRQYQLPVKVDYTISAKQSAFVRYQLSNNYTPAYVDPTDLLFTGATIAQLNNIQTTVIADNYTISPTLFSTTHIEANRSLSTRTIYNFAVPSQFGIPITAQIPGETTVSVTNGFTTGGAGAANPGYFNTLTYQGAQDFTWVKGKHQLQFGAQYIRAYMHAQNTRGVNGSLTFTGQFSSPTATSGVLGEGYADFLTGQMNGFSQGRPFYDDDRSDYYALYVQDAWRATAHLTLNLGLRFEPYLPQRNTDNYVELFSYANFVAGTVDTPPHANPVLTPPAGLIFSGDPGAPPNQQYNGRAEHLLPRIGLAWDPFGDGKTSIRASGGLLYDTPHMFFYTRVSNNPPWGATVSYNSGVDTPLSNPWVNYAGGDPFAPSASNTSSGGSGKNFGFFPLSGTYAVADPSLKSNEVVTWNLAIQRTMRKWLLSVTYIGNHSSHLWTSTEDNPVVYIPGTCAAGQYGLKAAGNCSSTANYTQRRLLATLNPTWAPYYNTIAYVDGGANASYNAAEMSAQHRLGNNFSVLANWTWSHALCDPVTTEVTGPTYEIPGNRNADYSNCPNDHRQQINISGVLQSPKMDNLYLNMIVNGWQIAPIYHWSTGNLTTITYGNDAALINTSGQRAQQILPDVYGTGGVNGYGYINPAAFLTDTTEVTGTFAPTKPNTVSNPDVWNIDASLSRNFRIRESKVLTFRAEAFNLTNSVMWGSVNANVASSTFGKLTPGIVQSTAAGGTQGRIMQFALKFAF